MTHEQHKTKIAPMVALAALGAGVLFSYLFYSKQPGVSFPVFFLFLGVVSYMLHAYSKRHAPADLWLAGPILLFASMPAVIDSPFLRILNMAASLGLFLLLIRSATGIRTKVMDVLDHFWNLLLVPLDALRSLVDATRFLSASRPKIVKESSGFRVLVGLLLAIPVLVVFGLLFASADLAFDRYVGSLFVFEIPEVWIERTILAIFGTLFAAVAFWRMLAVEPRTRPEEAPAPADGPSRGIEIATFLGAVALLFLFFIILQATYLFGGESNITQLGFTYAEYARKGFWELIAVGVITLALLLLTDRVAKRLNAKNLAFVIPSAFIVGEVFVIIISAFMRLGLYVDAYGETALRFYVAAAILFLFAVFAIAGYRILRAKCESFFTYGTLLALMTFIAVIDLINPDAFIARKNFELYKKTGKVDIEYLGTLSGDSVPTLLENMDLLNAGEREQLLRVLAEKRMRLRGEAGSWQSWNWSQSVAQRLLENMELPAVDPSFQWED